MKTFKSIIFLGLCFCLTFVNAQQQVSREEAVNAAINTLRYESQDDFVNRLVDTVFSLRNNGNTILFEVHFSDNKIVLLTVNA